MNRPNVKDYVLNTQIMPLACFSNNKEKWKEELLEGVSDE